MAKRSSIAFDNLVPRAWQAVAEWAAKCSQLRPPVRIEELANTYRVKQIEFEPLLSTAGIEKDGDGFVISVNPEADGATNAEGDVLKISAESLSPLASSVRFTLAHELAHLILYSLSDEDEDSFKNHEDRLEVTCNQLAGAIVLPKESLVREVDGKLFDAQHLARLLPLFRVSVDILVRRLHAPDLRSAFGTLDGALAVARPSNGALNISAHFSVGAYASIRWKPIEPSDETPGWDRLWLNEVVCNDIINNKSNRAIVDVLWHKVAKETIRCEVTSLRVRQADNSSDWH